MKLQQTGRCNQFGKEINFGQSMHARSDKEFIVSSCTNQRSKSASSYADLFMGGCGPGASRNFKSSTDWDLSNVRGQKFKASNAHDHQRGVSARDKIFAIKAEVRQYMPRDSGVTELSQLHQRLTRPRWCPTGLTHTQKRRVQRLRAFEMKEEIAGKKRLFDPEKSMMPKTTCRGEVAKGSQWKILKKLL